jgi:hypothetical protein
MKKQTISGYKVNTWFNKRTMGLSYGIDVKIDGDWMPVFTSVKGKAKLLFFKTEQEAKEKIKELKVTNAD